MSQSGGTSGPGSTPAADPAVLERNLAVIARRCPRTADRIRAATPRPDSEFALADDGGLTGTILENGVAGGQRKQLASRRAPIVEGERLADTLDLTTHAAFVVLGFGLGHHAAAIAARLKHLGALVVYEPDVALLRAVLERADYTATLGRTNLVLLTDADDTAAMAAAMSGLEGVLASGTRIVEHPGSKQRLAASAERFAATFTGVMRAVRTQIVTTLVQVEATLRNCLQNLETYATAPGIDDLVGSCRGRPAVVVSAGPSLERNVELLARPGVRDRVVIIAVQTALKPLLARGIKPHFVTALDYHEISRRFYEGLTAKDVEGVTLVVEPKANPAILEAFPGQVRCVGDHVLDRVLGDPESSTHGIAQPRARLNPGATVAHLAYYLARALGADPVLLIGQDLGFTDGQYYAAGAAIHRVWAPELHEFRTLEMFEWERIMRMKATLHRVTDQLGRPMFTDEQMATYLVQFERDFTQDQSAGLTTIDATEGGTSKRGTTISTLADALAQHARGVITLPRTPEADTSHRRRDAVMQRLRTLNQQVMRISTLGRETAGYLGEMIEHHSEQARVNRLIGKAQANAQEAASLVDAHWLVQFVNQTGQLNRYKADRAIEIDPTLSDMDRQRMQIERDLKNVIWLADAADRVSVMLCDAMRAIETGKRLTRDPLPPAPPLPMAGAAAGVGAKGAAGTYVTPGARSGGGARAKATIAAAILVDPEIGGLGRPRPLDVPFAGAPNLLAATLARVIAADAFDRIALITTDEQEARRLLAAAAAHNPAIAAKQSAITIHTTDRDRLRTRLSSVGAARLFGRWCWRGGLGGMSVFDEAFDPAAAAALCAELDLDGLAAINADWCCIDPAITRELVDRFRERPDPQSLTFTQAPPGIAPAVLGRGVIEQLATNSGPFINVGALLSYIPVMPQADPIARTACVAVAPEIRDTLERCIADGPESRARIERAVRTAQTSGEAASGNTPAGEAAAFLAALRSDTVPPPAEIITVTADAESNAEQLAAALTPMLRSAEHAAVTIDARSPGSLAAATALAERLAARGVAAIHMRTALREETTDTAAAALAFSPAILSLDLYANQETTYRAITGRDDFTRVNDLAASLLEQRDPAAAAGLPRTWIVPRITRCDATYEDIEGFYDNWLMRAGACVIDPFDESALDDATHSAVPAETRRIRPLPIPGHALKRFSVASIAISADAPSADTAAAGTVHA